MSDTPRTDAELFRPCNGCVEEKLEVVSADFARQLERELATMKTARDDLVRKAVADAVRRGEVDFS